MSTNTQPETRSVSFQHSGTSSRALAPTCWFTRANIRFRGDVDHSHLAAVRRSDSSLVDLSIAGESNLRLHEPKELQTVTEFLNLTRLLAQREQRVRPECTRPRVAEKVWLSGQENVVARAVASDKHGARESRELVVAPGEGPNAVGQVDDDRAPVARAQTADDSRATGEHAMPPTGEVVRMGPARDVRKRMVAPLLEGFPWPDLAAAVRGVEGVDRVRVAVQAHGDLLPVRLVLVQAIFKEIETPVLDRVFAGVAVTRDVGVHRRLAT